MLNKLNVLLAALFLITWNLNAQNMPEIGGEINTRASVRLDSSQQVWSRTTFRLRLDSELNKKTHAYANLKMYNTETSQFDWKLSEAYVDYYGGKFDLRTGIQVISWGTAYRTNPTDNINPFDLSEQEAFIPEERLGVTAMRLKYYPLTNIVLTGVYIPYFVPALEIPGVALPEKNLANSEYAVKLTAQSIMGYDFSASYFKGKEDYPWTNGQYRDVEVFGGDVIGTIGEVALWAEGAYTKPDIGDSCFQIATGGEYTFGNDLYCMGQLYHRNYPDVKENYLMAVLRYPFRDIHTFQLGMAYETENEVFIAFPEVTLSLSDAASLVVTAFFLDGDLEGTFLSEMKDKIFVKIEYSF